MSEKHVLGTVDRYEYHWCDGVTYKKPTKLSAAKYIELLMEWVEVQINNEDLFPQTVGEQHDDVSYCMLELGPDIQNILRFVLKLS